MPNYLWTNYLWKGINSQGKKLKGQMKTTSPKQLKETLLSDGVALISYREHHGLLNSLRLITNNKITLEHLFNFFDHLALLIRSGIPLVQALPISSQQTTNKKLQQIITKIVTDIRRGNTLSLALQQHSNVFNIFVIKLIKAGEKSGKIASILERIAQQIKEQIKLKSKLKQAMFGPILTLTFAIIIILGIFILIIPQFGELFNAMNKPLPPLTQKVLSISKILNSHATIYFLILVPSICLTIKTLGPKNRLKKLKANIILKLYYINSFVRLSEIINLLQTSSILLKSGIPLNQALQTASNTLHTTQYQEKVLNVSRSILNGKSFEQSLKQEGANFFPDSLVSMISIGEHSGNLSIMLDKAAILFQTILQAKIRFLTKTLQPILLVLIGILIGGLMISVYLPIFNLADTL